MIAASMVGKIYVPDDTEFRELQRMLENDEGWKREVKKDKLKVWTKPNPVSNFKMIKIHATFPKIDASLIFDVVMDSEYRKVWDTNTIDSADFNLVNPNNDLGYYSVRCPRPLKNRDFVLQRSWLQLGHDYFIMSHSINHAKYPIRANFVRAISYITGYVIKGFGSGSSEFYYVTQADPQGKLPVWLVDKITTLFAPKFIKKMQKACRKYPAWKAKQSQPDLKPWVYPEQILALDRFDPSDLNEFDVVDISRSNEKEGEDLQSLKSNDIQTNGDELFGAEEENDDLNGSSSSCSNNEGEDSP